VSNFSAGQLRRAQQIAPVETLQPPYSLIARDAEAEILLIAGREGTGVIVYSPMGSGLLTGVMTRERIAGLPDDWRKHDLDFTEPRLSEHLRLVERIRAVAGRHGTSAGAVRGRLDAVEPGRQRRDRRLPPPRPGRRDHRRRQSPAQRRRFRDDRRKRLNPGSDR
jgi:aldo/keto reductase family protein